MNAMPKEELEALVELAHAGAVQAADAFGLLAAQSVETSEPIVVHAADRASGKHEASENERGVSGVFFEFEGCLHAVVGILFPAEASDRLVRRIVGIESGELEAPIVESALMEVGNILASHVASAIADRLESRLLPSIPSLSMGDAEQEFQVFLDRVAGADVPRVESRLEAEDGGLLGRLILVPTR